MPDAGTANCEQQKENSECSEYSDVLEGAGSVGEKQSGRGDASGNTEQSKALERKDYPVGDDG